MEVVVIELEGGIDQFPLLMQTVDNLIADGTRQMVVDLQPLPFINSAALGYLIKAHKSMEELGGAFALARVQPAIARILQDTKLDTVLPCFQSVDEAVGYVAADLSRSEGEAPRIQRTVLKLES